jgi:hypothetical protein
MENPQRVGLLVMKGMACDLNQEYQNLIDVCVNRALTPMA